MLTLRLAATAGVAEYEAMDSAREGLSTGGGRNSLWIAAMLIVEGSLEVKLPTIWRDEKQSRAEAERRGRLAERRSEEKE
jgi:hypothetical protein